MHRHRIYQTQFQVNLANGYPLVKRGFCVGSAKLTNKFAENIFRGLCQNLRSISLQPDPLKRDKTADKEIMAEISRFSR